MVVQEVFVFKFIFGCMDFFSVQALLYPSYVFFYTNFLSFVTLLSGF